MYSGEWFYVHYYIDAPGNNRGVPWTDDEIEGPKIIEDTANLARYGGGTNSTANYWYLSDVVPMSIRYDPAIVEINATDNVNDPPGNGTLTFFAAAGTKLKVITAMPNTNKNQLGWNNDNGKGGYTSSSTASNKMGAFLQISDYWSNSVPGPAGSYYPWPGDGARGCCGSTQVSWDYGRIALRAKTGLVAGQGSRITISFSSSTTIFSKLTENDPYGGGSVGHLSENMRGSTWPTWCEILPGDNCPGVNAQTNYNSERTYICIQ
jgi:hypothetical protein